MSAADLQGLPSVFPALGLLRDEGGKVVIDAESAAALRDVFAKIEEGANLGRRATGKSLTEDFGAAPYGWDLEVVRLFVASLMRAGKIQMTHKGDSVDDPRSVAGKDGLGNNNHFKAASFQPKKGIDFEALVNANLHFKSTFGFEIKELSESSVARSIRTAVDDCRDDVESERNRLAGSRLPGVDVLDDALAEARAIMRGTEADAIMTFNSAHEKLKDGIKRAGELKQYLTPDALGIIEQGRRTLLTQWPFLNTEPDLDPAIRDAAERLDDLLAQELFFREVASIEAAASTIAAEHERRFGEALQAKVGAYMEALSKLTAVTEWSALTDATKEEVAAPLQRHATDDGSTHPQIPQLRADRDACVARLAEAVQRVHQIVEGDRMVEVSIEPFFRGGVGDLEQLDAALQGLRDECERLIAANKKIFIK